MKSNKIKLVTVRLTEDEYRLLQDSADENMRSIGGQIRYDLFGKDEVEE